MNNTTDDFITTAQSDEMASEWEQHVADFNAYLDEQEQKYWQQIGARSN